MKENMEAIKKKLREETINEMIFYNIIDSSEYSKYNSPLEKYINYYNGCFDVASSFRLMVVFSLVFPFVNDCDRLIEMQVGQGRGRKLEFRNNNEDIKYRGEILNSVNKSMHKYLSKLNIEESKKIYTKRYNKNRYSYYYDIDWENSIRKNIDYYDSVVTSEMQMFIMVNQSIGNYMPIPFISINNGEINVSKNSMIGDYFDLVLLCIYNYYLNNDINELIKLVGKKKTNINLGKTWLGMFNGWEDFINKYYLQDFVESNYGKPKEFWEGHFSSSVQPKDEKDIKDYYMNATCYIVNRGRRISIAVKEKLNEELRY